MQQVEEDMGKHTHETDDASGLEKKKKSEEDCRCKEVSEMSPRDLLRTMFNDLAFWKKEKKE